MARRGWASFWRIQSGRLVSRELLPLQIHLPENEEVESERLRGLSRAVRSRVKRRVGWQGWANAGVRSMNEIFGKTATSEAGGRPSAMQLSSLSRICDACPVMSAGKGRVAPHTDPELKRKPQSYARLIRDMGLRGLVSFGVPFMATVGVVVDPKN